MAGQSNNKKQIVQRIIEIMLFVAYLAALVYLVFVFERGGVQEYRYNLRPFEEIRRFYQYRSVVGNRVFLYNVVGNIMVFVPMGFFVPLVFRRYNNGFFVTLLCAELSLAIEITQLLTKVGSFDVDDLLLNTLGGLLGHLLFIITVGRRRKKGGR